MKYTLDTDFSSLNGPKAANWIMGFQDMAQDAFADSNSQSRLLGNLLILEPYVHTLRQGLADKGRMVPAVLQRQLMFFGLSALLMELVAVSGGRLDFEEYEEYEQDVDFVEMDEMLNMLADAFIDFTDTPLSSNKAIDVMNAQEQVYRTSLFRQFIERIQNGLIAALSAVPEQYPALRKEYRQYTIFEWANK